MLANQFRNVLLLTILIVGFGAQAHDSDSPFAEWMASRKQPDSPTVSCCGEADQYWVRSYEASSEPGVAFHAIVEDKVGGTFEINVPPEKVDWQSVNPTGRGVIFISSSGFDAGYGAMVFCFIPGNGV